MSRRRAGQLALFRAPSAPSPTPAPTSSESSVTWLGATFSFASAVPVGQYINGESFAVGATVNGDAPAHEVVAGGTVRFSDVESVSLQATGDTVTKTAHGLVADQKVRFDALGGATGISTGVDYYARTITANTFQLAATAGGAAIDITANGTNAQMRRYVHNPRTKNGMMSNAGSNGSLGGADQVQGYDSLDSVDAVSGSTIQDYSDGLNIAPSKTSTPLSGNRTLTKVVSIAEPNLEGRQNITDMAHLHIVDAVPVIDSFAPHSSDTAKTPFFTGADLDAGIPAWPTLAVPSGTSLPTKAEILAQLRPMTQFTNNLFSRSIQPSNQTRSYGANIACSIAQALCWLCCTGPSNADKREVAVQLTQLGIDIWRRTVNGGRWPSLNASFGGGQHWVKMPLVFAAWILRNAANTTARASIAEYADAAQRNFFQSDRTIFAVDRAQIETTPNSGSLPVYAPYLDYMENSLDWNSKPSSRPTAGSGFNHRYREINGNPHLPAIVALRQLGITSYWNRAQFFDYHDAYYQWWVQNGSGNSYMTTDQSATFIKRMVETYYAGLSPALSAATAPAAVRYEARNRHVWVEYDRYLDRSIYPDVSAFVVEVAGSPVTLPIDRTTTCNITSGSANVTVASATGIVVGMRANLPNFPKPTHVAAVSGTTITLSTSASATASGQTVTFHAVDVWGKSLSVCLPSALTNGQSVTIAYTQPGSNQARALGGGLAPSFSATSATNRTGSLPAAVTSRATVFTGSNAALRQFSGANGPAAESFKRAVLSLRFWLSSKTANDTILSNQTGSTTNFRFWFPSASDLRFSIGAGSAISCRMPGAGTALPTDTLITMHMIFDFTGTSYATMYRPIFRWDGGSHTPSLTGSTGATDGSLVPDIGTWFNQGIFLGAIGTGSSPMHGGFRELLLGWGGAGYSLPSDFSGSQFAWDADWGGNGENVWGGAVQRYYAGPLDEWNGSVPNRGNGATTAMTPRRYDSATEDLAQEYVAWP